MARSVQTAECEWLSASGSVLSPPGVTSRAAVSPFHDDAVVVAHAPRRFRVPLIPSWRPRAPGAVRGVSAGLELAAAFRREFSTVVQSLGYPRMLCPWSSRRAGFGAEVNVEVCEPRVDVSPEVGVRGRANGVS